MFSSRLVPFSHNGCAVLHSVARLVFARDAVKLAAARVDRWQQHCSPWNHERAPIHCTKACVPPSTPSRVGSNPSDPDPNAGRLTPAFTQVETELAVLESGPPAFLWRREGRARLVPPTRGKMFQPLPSTTTSILASRVASETTDLCNHPLSCAPSFCHV